MWTTTTGSTFLNARAEEFVAANPKIQPDWFELMQKVFDAQQAFVFSDDSPNWYRGTAMCHPYSESFNTERFLKQVGARQLVMGHTPTRGDVQCAWTVSLSGWIPAC